MIYLLPALLAIVLGAFALANPQLVTLSLWPAGWAVELPAWQAVLIPAVAGFLLGAIIVWFAHLHIRRDLAQLRQAASLLDAELASREPAPAKHR